jgi:hypothetical protein
MSDGLQNNREAREPADLRRLDARFRCLCCNGVIETLFDRDVSHGLDLKMGFVFGEYSFICDGCTATLIAERTAASPAARQRGTPRTAARYWR